MGNSLAIILPMYNPIENWHLQIVKYFNETFLSSSYSYVKLYIVNDGSSAKIPDKQIDFIKQNIQQVDYLQYSTNQGKGFALRYGIEKIKEDYILYTDVDFPFNKQSMLSVLSALQTNDIVVGVKDETYYSNVPLKRKIISRYLQQLIKFLFPKLVTTDTQCGLKAMNQKGRELFLQTKINRYLFDLEFIFLASKTTVAITTIPVRLRDGVEFSKMNYKILFHELGNFMSILFKK